MKNFRFLPQIKQYLDKAEEYQSMGVYDKAIIQLRIAVQSLVAKPLMGRNEELLEFTKN